MRTGLANAVISEQAPITGKLDAVYSMISRFLLSFSRVPRSHARRNTRMHVPADCPRYGRKYRQLGFLDALSAEGIYECH
jgi:hypothetical protein